MGWCEFCGKGMDEGHSHAECRGEYDRRQDAGLCVFCSKWPVTEYDWCAVCAAGPRPVPYVGYPPGGA